MQIQVKLGSKWRLLNLNFSQLLLLLFFFYNNSTKYNPQIQFFLQNKIAMTQIQRFKLIQQQLIEIEMAQYDRPIKPDKKYIQEFMQKQEQTKEVRQYLKKRSVPSLPCFTYNLNQIQHKKKRSREKSITRKSKAQLYEQIKAKNRQKFGQREKSNQILNQQQKDRNKQKINPKNMTVSYQPKKPKINTQQFKKPQYKKTAQQQRLDQEEQKKVNYEKMMEKMKKEMLKIESQRKQYQMALQQLKIKNLMLQKSQNPIKRFEVQSQQLILAKNTTQQSKTKNSKISVMSQNQNQNTLQLGNTGENSKILKSVQKSRVKSNKKEVNFNKISSSRLHKNKFYGNKFKPESQKQNKYKVPIEKFNDIKGMSLLQQRQCIDLQNLQYDGNQKYHQALQIVQNHKRDKVKTINQKRITKFDDEWIQVWNPGKQRTVTNSSDYKVTWFSNGDIKQQFNAYGFVKSYFCKARKVVEITFGDKDKVYYFPETQQIQTISENKKLKEVVFADGNYQVMQISCQ